MEAWSAASSRNSSGSFAIFAAIRSASLPPLSATRRMTRHQLSGGAQGLDPEHLLLQDGPAFG